MKFGVFLPTGSDGFIMSSAVEPYLPTWDLNKATTIEAENQGLDFVLSMMKFRGFGGTTGYWDGCMESFTTTAALAQVTRRIGIVPTATILALHPAYVARMVSTLDDISDGRIALNIVTGWNKPEYVQMGLWKGDEYYDRRYEFAQEYVSILRALWQEGRVTHHGEFFDLEDCRCLPMPLHDIPMVSAGQSTAGRQFVASIGGYSFVMAAPAKLRGIAEDIKAAGRAKGTRVGVYALFHMVVAPTDAQAWSMANRIVEMGDLDAIRTMIAAASMDTVKDGTSQQLKESAGDADTLLAGDPEVGNMAFMGYPAIVGGYDTMAEKIDAIAADPNLDGILFSWPNWVEGIRDFGTHVMPRLKCRQGWDVEAMGGLRGPGMRRQTA